MNPRRKNVLPTPKQCWPKSQPAVEEKKDELNFSIPGLQHVFDTRQATVVKLCWFLIVTISIGTCLWQTIDRFQLYLSNPIETRVSIHRNTSLKFPSISVCAFDHAHILLQDGKMRWAEEINIHRKQSHSTTPNITGCEINSFDFLKYFNMTTLWENMSTHGLINFANMMTRTDYALGKYQLVHHKWTSTTAGNCSTFSFKKLIPVINGDLHMQIVFWPHKIYCKKKYLTAMYMIHEDDEDITYKFASAYYSMPTNTTLVFGIKAREIRLLNRPEDPCETDNAVANLCERTCIDNFLVKQNFSCKFPYTSHLDLPYCVNSHLAKMITIHSFILGSSVDYSSTCSCLPRCNQTLYTKTMIMASTHWPLLRFVYENNIIERLEYFYSYNLISFLCDVGGNIGLFLGLCIPAVIDMLQSFVVFVYKKWAKFNHKI